jgi:5-methylcytosine-specific restriction endonuclease McrA
MAHPAYRTRRWQIVRRQVLERDGWRCQLCGEPIDTQAPPRSPRSATVDHIVSLLDGGAWYDLPNLRAAHHVCNSVRANTARAARPMVKYQPPRRW